MLADSNNIIVASSSSQELGTHIPELKQRKNYSWQTTEIKNTSGLVGTLAIEFSNKELNIAYANARDFGVTIALIGMFIIAIVGLIVGFLLTRRLEIITHTAKLLSQGDYKARTNIHARDEVGVLATAFDDMAQHLLESKDNLNEALTALQEREQKLGITLNSIGDAVITTDPVGNITHMNPVAEQLTGWQLEEAKGQPLKTIFPIINAATREPIENPN